jgi:hypothetical protein
LLLFVGADIIRPYKFKSKMKGSLYDNDIKRTQ